MFPDMLQKPPACTLQMECSFADNLMMLGGKDFRMPFRVLGARKQNDIDVCFPLWEYKSQQLISYFSSVTRDPCNTQRREKMLFKNYLDWVWSVFPIHFGFSFAERSLLKVLRGCYLCKICVCNSFQYEIIMKNRSCCNLSLWLGIQTSLLWPLTFEVLLALPQYYCVSQRFFKIK